jgi:DNA-binding CsgD family transcriptional regulator
VVATPTGELLERDAELTVGSAAVRDAVAGSGRVLLIQGPPGIGKTKLLDALCADGQRAARVLRARGGQQERDLPLAVAREWFEPVLARCDRQLRASLLAGAAGLAAPLFDTGSVAESPFAVVHGLYWLMANLAERRPLLLAVDDAHWVDEASQRLLAYLIPRVGELHVVLALTLRPRELDPSSQLAGALASLPDPVIVEPKPLTPSGTTALAGGDAAFGAAVQQVTRGNPLLVHTLVTAVRASGIEPVAANAERVASLAGFHIDRVVLPRLHQLGAAAVALARAAAILGEGCVLADVAALAELDLDTARAAANALIAADVLSPVAGFSFTHPLVRAAVLDELSPPTRSRWYRRAAQRLHTTNASAIDVARLLLFVEPIGDDWALDVLRNAAADAAARGGAESAVAYLERALAEPVDAQTRAAVMGELGWAAFHANHRGTVEWMADAVRLCADQAARASAWNALLFATLLRGERLPADLVLRELSPVPEDAALRLAAAQLADYMSGTVQDAFAVTLPQPNPPPDGATDGERTWLAAAALRAVMTCESAGYASELARRALTAPAQDGRDAGFPHSDAAFALIVSDGPTSALAALERGIAETIGKGSLPEFQRYSVLRAVARLAMGDLGDAAADLGVTDHDQYSWQRGVPLMVAAALDVLRGQGELEAADALAARYPLVDPQRSRDLMVAFLLDSRGRLRSAQSRFADALEDFRACGELLRERGVPHSPMFSWRAGAAHCLAALHRRADARELAQEQLDDARRFGAAIPVGASLRSLGVVTGGSDGIDLLRESVDVLAGTAAKLHYAQALCDLGTALRHAKHPLDAREPLRLALDLADRCRARAVADRATFELRAAGAKPRRRAVSGADALTASERRVAGLAAEGLSNPEIAQSLFITRKTVEKHLGNAYLKLGVTSRADLAGALGRT